jgi:hypothetical protein
MEGMNRTELIVELVAQEEFLKAQACGMDHITLQDMRDHVSQMLAVLVQNDAIEMFVDADGNLNGQTTDKGMRLKRDLENGEPFPF